MHVAQGKYYPFSHKSRRSITPARVLLTARRQDWPADLGLQGLPLAVFTPSESRAFLRQRLPAAGLEKTSTLWNNLGYHLKMSAAYEEARAAYERALAIFERFLPAEHPHIQIVRGHLERLGKG